MVSLKKKGLTRFEWLPDVNRCVGFESFRMTGKTAIDRQVAVIHRIEKIIIDVESNVRIVHPISFQIFADHDRHFDVGMRWFARNDDRITRQSLREHHHLSVLHN